MRWFSKLAGPGALARTLALHVHALTLVAFALSACGGAEPAANAPTTEVHTGAPAATPDADSASGTAAQKSFLWQIDSSTTTLYLLGSIHVAKQDLYPLSPAIENAYQRSDALVLEVQMTQEVEAEVALKSVKLGLYPAGDSVDQHLSAETWTLYSQYLEERGKPLQVYVRMKPWLASVALMLETLGESGFNPTHGVDRHFQQRAEKDKKPIKSLETVDDQLNALAGIDDPTQELMLREFLQSEADVGQQLDDAFDAWQRGDAAALESIMLESMRAPEYRPVFEKLFVERNLRMKAKLSEYLAGGSVHFVVVGSGHLVGEAGLVELLRRDQHQVDQL